MIKRKTLDLGESREDRFMLPGIDFKAKLIGIEPVGDARGDKMCLDAMIKLKYLIKNSGEHKPRIVVNVSIEGIRILDERTREVLHKHEVHRISFISRDPTDPRAFGYVYGEHGNHKFYGIKTEKQADNLVMTLKDLFEVVLELKKQQIADQKAAEQITAANPAGEDTTDSQPKQIASFKNPPPVDAEGGEEGTDPVYAQVDKSTKLSVLAAHLNEQDAPLSSGLLNLEEEVKNIQMGIDTMQELDLHPQTPTSPQPDLFASPPSAPVSDPFAFPGPPPLQKAPIAKAVSLDSAFGSSDPFALQAAPTAATNTAPPPANSAPSDDLFKEFKDTFTAPVQMPVTAFQTPMAQASPNPFGNMQPAPAASFQTNFGGMGGAPAPFGGTPGMFGAPAPMQQPVMQQPVDPFAGGPAFDNDILTPESTNKEQASVNSQKSDPFASLGALSSSKTDSQKSAKDMFANYKIGKPGEPQPPPEIKLTGGPRRPPPAIPTSPQSSMSHAALSPPNTFNLRKLHTFEDKRFALSSPKGPPPPLPPGTFQNGDSKCTFDTDAITSLPVPSTPPPPLPAYININDINKITSHINLGHDAPAPPLPPRSKSSSQLRLSVSNPLPVPPRNRTRSSQSSPPSSPRSDSASIKSCDARFVSSPTPHPALHRVSSPSIVSSNSGLSTLDETHADEHSSGVTSNSAPSHSNSMNSLSSVFDSNNVSTDTFDNDSNAASPLPSPIASSLCHESSAKPVDRMPSKTSSATHPNRPCSISRDSLYSSVEMLSQSSMQTIHPSLHNCKPSHSHNHDSSHPSQTRHASCTNLSTSGPVSHSSLSSSSSRSSHSVSPLTLPKLPVHEDPFADDPFSRHSPSVKKTFVLDICTNSSASSTTTTTTTTTTTKNSASTWSSHPIKAKTSDFDSCCVVTSDPFAPGGALVTNGTNSGGNDLFGSFDAFDFSNPNQ